MTMDCHWVEKNLEALFCDSLNPEESRLARAHIESCVSCRKEVDALNAIDPVIKKYFQGQAERARQPRAALNARRAFGLSTAAAALAAILLFAVLRAPQMNPVVPLPPVQPQVAPTASAETPAPIKNDAAGKVERAKPIAGGDKVDEPKPVTAPVVSANSPDFLVTDLAGYSHRLDEYRGHVVVVGVWGTDQSEAVANIERLYKTFGSNPKFRFLGVSSERLAKPANTTFPVVYNQGSKVFGAQPGEFVLLDETGSIELRGSLTKDFDSLRKALQEK